MEKQTKKAEFGNLKQIATVTEGHVKLIQKLKIAHLFLRQTCFVLSFQAYLGSFASDDKRIFRKSC